MDSSESWKDCKLGDFITLKNGYAFKSEDYTNEGIPVIRISDIQDGQVTTNESIRINKSKIKEGFEIRKGDVLVAMSGATTGKIGRFVSDELAFQNQRVGNLVPKDSRISKSFVYYWIQIHKKDIEDQAYGGAQPNISSKLIEEIPTRLPPPSEQKLIVAKLDKLFSHLDQLKVRLEKIPELLKQFRQAVLTQAVTGRLTEEWREGKDLTGVVIRKVRKEGKALITDRVGEYQLCLLPDYWSWRIISEVADVKGGKRLPKGESLVSENTGFPYIKAGDLKEGTVLISQLEYLQPKTQEKIKRYIVNKGDVYITNVGACIGDAGIIPNELDNANLTENALKICNHDGVFNYYLAFWLRSPMAQDFIKKTILSGAQGKLALGRVESFPIPLPPLEEQKEIVRRVESLFAKADRIEASYKTLKEKIDQLPQAILSKAFRGELVKAGDQEVFEQIQSLAAEAKEVYEVVGKKK